MPITHFAHFCRLQTTTFVEKFFLKPQYTKNLSLDWITWLTTKMLLPFEMYLLIKIRFLKHFCKFSEQIDKFIDTMKKES